MNADWTDELLSDSREIVIRLLTDPVSDLQSLADEVVAYQRHIHRAARFATDLELADTLVGATLDLLHRTEGAPDDDRRLAGVAARYLVYDDDGDDLISPFGFDDDVEVFNAVAARVAPELMIAG